MSTTVSFMRPSRKRNTDDEAGKVRITMALVGPGGRSVQKGNITHSLTVLGRVSDVATIVENALIDHDRVTKSVFDAMRG